jgi:LEA14-like dessication related protein
VLLLCAAGCAPKFERPNLAVTGVEMRGGNLLQQNFLVKFQVQNPNQRALPVNGLHAELSVGGERIASGVSNQSFVVPPLGQKEFDMTITARSAVPAERLSIAQAISLTH